MRTATGNGVLKFKSTINPVSTVGKIIKTGIGLYEMQLEAGKEYQVDYNQ